ncbi:MULTISPECIES: AbrB/MazE/SpoVT family DNA-binding domain-containing protein [unclassified Lactobacillus]|uniref:AbrB/MazE/SpoVT family DNA-binding domain-containing protein n=1 Tax=unclassified Lactobacillus TaxID=2620435 RepID=UPI0023FA04A6|nr:MULTISPECIES: AbrB/MazE/SpoVT family DNA-binding domain-containing protein [unclassified Lactobacillus]MDF7668229.1 AbrB/MazE/SpoVT family DNA-binding domain-containing protein [Lactobacillus sp. ESL0703]WEV38048.1 AbrB/MazE/SpoVT family DNA-binding domain-containing protein [Lactobacillus sp. ESL0680]
MEQTSKLSSKGQIVIPVAIRRKLGLQDGDELSISVNNDELIIKKMPTALEWADLIKDIPTEKVDIDKNGHYDAKKSPDFHDWMVNG